MTMMPDRLLPLASAEPPASSRAGGRAVTARPPADAGMRAGSALLRLPEDLADLLDLGEKLVRLGHVGAALGAAGTGELGGLVEQRMELRVLLEVRRLEVVGPQHPQVVLDQFGPLFLDDQRAGLERWVVAVLVLLADGLDGLGLDACLRRVVDPAGEVAVRIGNGLRFQETGEQPHRSPFLCRIMRYRSPTLPNPARPELGGDTCAGHFGAWRWLSGPWSRRCTAVTGCLFTERSSGAGRCASGRARSWWPVTRSARTC